MAAPVGHFTIKFNSNIFNDLSLLLIGGLCMGQEITGSSQVLASLSAFGELSVIMVISLSWNRWTIFEP